MMRSKIKLVICSGKGGVGKSMLASALSMLFSQNKNLPRSARQNLDSFRIKKVVAVDCDVDAPNLAVWLGEPEKWQTVKKISVSEKPVIADTKLNKKEAERCAKKCRFNALEVEKGKLKLNPFLCEGCGACEVFCPEGVIKMKPVKNGEIKLKKTKYNFPLVSGHLFPGETGSGKIVTEIKKEADRFDCDIQILDSAPGTGCPVVASLQDANFAILITEPTPSGFSDLLRVLEVVNHFKIPWNLVINKWDINPQLSGKIEKWSRSRFLGKISYEKKIFQAISNLVPILKTNLKAKKEIQEIYKNLITKL